VAKKKKTAAETSKVTAPVSVELYNQVVKDYLVEGILHNEIEEHETSVESRFGDVLTSSAVAFELSENQADEECDKIDNGDYATPEIRRRISLQRMFTLGVEIGYRLGQSTPAGTEAKRFAEVRDEVAGNGALSGLLQGVTSEVITAEMTKAGYFTAAEIDCAVWVAERMMKLPKGNAGLVQVEAELAQAKAAQEGVWVNVPREPQV
jgi:hypothetical protein